MDDKQAFWDRQASEGSLSGTKDRYAKELEMAVIAKHVDDYMRVLDVGCGDGETLEYLAKQKDYLSAVGIDFSGKMVAKAKARVSLRNYIILQSDIRNLRELTILPFDLIYTQRALINLDTWKEQRQAILDIISLLNPDGTYVMVECFQEGLQEINELRLAVGLESIVPPWHNRYINYTNELIPLLAEQGLQYRPTWDNPPMRRCFSGAYYFMSRIVNAWWEKNFGREPEYDSSLNFLGTLLPPDCVNLCGQTQAWIIRKKP